MASFFLIVINLLFLIFRSSITTHIVLSFCNFIVSSFAQKHSTKFFFIGRKNFDFSIFL